MSKVILRAGKIGIGIVLPLIILGLVLYVLKVVSVAQTGEVVLVAQDITLLEQDAESYLLNGHIPEAEQSYLTIVQQYPGTDSAFAARKNLAILYANSGDDAKADAAIYDLVTDYPQRDGLGQSVCDIADRYRKLNRHGKARDLYANNLDSFANDDSALWSRMGYAISSIELKDNVAALAATQQLIEENSLDEHVSTALCLIADTYRKVGKHELSCQLYDYVLTDWPNTEYNFWSRMGLIISSIQQNNCIVADVAVDELLENYPQDSRTPNAVCRIADSYRKRGRHAKARELYDYVVGNWPNAEHALWSKMGAAVASIELSDPNGADSDLTGLFADFSEDSRMSVAACSIGDAFRKGNQNQKARAYYEYVVDNWSGSKHALWSQMGLVISNIKLSSGQEALDSIDDLLMDHIDDDRVGMAVCQVANELHKQGKDKLARRISRYFLDNWSNPDLQIWSDVVAVNAYVDSADPNVIGNLIADYSGHPQLPQAAFSITERFYNRALDLDRQGRSGHSHTYLQKAVKGWETIVARLPETDHVTKESYQLAGDCYRRLGRHVRAIECYQRIVDTWPYSEMAWNAQYMIGYSYERIKEGGVVPEPDADLQIKGAYERLLATYPDCPAAKAANNWLKRNAATGKGGRG